MAEDRKHTAHINRKGLDATGVTEDHARALSARPGATVMLIVEARVQAVTNTDEGKVKTALVLTNVEPVPDDMEDSVRELQRALYRKRPEVEGQEVLSGTSGSGQSAEDALRDARAAADPAWDGDPAAPPPAKKAAAKKKVGAGAAGDPFSPPEQGATCPTPGCTLPPHDLGEHQIAEAGEG